MAIKKVDTDTTCLGEVAGELEMLQRNGVDSDDEGNDEGGKDEDEDEDDSDDNDE